MCHCLVGQYLQHLGSWFHVLSSSKFDLVCGSSVVLHVFSSWLGPWCCSHAFYNSWTVAMLILLSFTAFTRLWSTSLDVSSIEVQISRLFCKGPLPDVLLSCCNGRYSTVTRLILRINFAVGRHSCSGIDTNATFCKYTLRRRANYWLVLLRCVSSSVIGINLRLSTFLLFSARCGRSDTISSRCSIHPIEITRNQYKFARNEIVGQSDEIFLETTFLSVWQDLQR